MSLRAQVEKAIQNSPYDSFTGNILYGFSSTVIGCIIMIMVAYIIYDVNKKNSYSQTLENIQAILQEHRHVLPLYYSKEWRELIKSKKMDTTEVKPFITIDVPFIVPSIDTSDNADVPAPALSSLKRRKNLSEVFEINKEDI